MKTQLLALSLILVTSQAMASLKVGDKTVYRQTMELSLGGQTMTSIAISTQEIMAISPNKSGEAVYQVKEINDGPNGVQTSVSDRSLESILMASDLGVKTPEAILQNCASFPDAKVIQINLKSGPMDACQIHKVDGPSYETRIYANVPFYVYKMEAYGEENGNTLRMTIQYQE